MAAINPYRPSSAVDKCLHGFLFKFKSQVVGLVLFQVVSVEETVVEEEREGCGVCDMDFAICIQVVEVVLDCGD